MWFSQIVIYEDGSMLIRMLHGRRQIEEEDTALESYQTNEINQRNQLYLKRNQNKLPKNDQKDSISS